MAIVLFGGEIQNVVTVTIFVNFHPLVSCWLGKMYISAKRGWKQTRFLQHKFPSFSLCKWFAQNYPLINKVKQREPGFFISTITEEGFIQKRRQRSSLLLGGQNRFSIPCRASYFAQGRVEEKADLHPFLQLFAVKKVKLSQKQYELAS